MNLKFKRQPVETVAAKFEYIPKILKGEGALEERDYLLVSEYLNNLGHSDALSQVDYLNGKRAELLKLKEESAENYKKYGSLYIKIFFMVGVLIAVLLI